MPSPGEGHPLLGMRPGFHLEKKSLRGKHLRIVWLKAPQEMGGGGGGGWLCKHTFACEDQGEDTLDQIMHVCNQGPHKPSDDDQEVVKNPGD